MPNGPTPEDMHDMLPDEDKKNMGNYDITDYLIDYLRPYNELYDIACILSKDNVRNGNIIPWKEKTKNTLLVGIKFKNSFSDENIINNIKDTCKKNHENDIKIIEDRINIVAIKMYDK